MARRTTKAKKRNPRERKELGSTETDSTGVCLMQAHRLQLPQTVQAIGQALDSVSRF